MFSNTLVAALYLFASCGFSANALPGSQPNAKSERSVLERADGLLRPRGFSSFGESTQVTTFMSSWQTLSQSFDSCRSAFYQRSSITIVSQSVQTLYTSYQTAVGQYGSCSACASSLSQATYRTQIETHVTRMYRCFQEILTYGQQYYASYWQSQFSSTFQSMSGFAQFSHQVCSSASINLGSILGSIGINQNLFGNLGMNLGEIINGAIGGIVGNGQNGGLLGGNLLGGNKGGQSSAMPGGGILGGQNGGLFGGNLLGGNKGGQSSAMPGGGILGGQNGGLLANILR